MFKAIYYSFLLLLASNSFAAQPWLGFTFKQRGCSASTPCSLDVAGVQQGSGAAQAGLQVGDIVVKVDGKPFFDMATLQHRMKVSKVGDKLDVNALRTGQLSTFHIILTARPDDIRNLMGSHVGSKAYPLGNFFYANKAAQLKSPKAILLDFWATWCGPCQAALPMIRKLYEQYHAQGFEVIGISADKLGMLQDFQAERPEPWALYHDQGDIQSAKWGVTAIPTLILLDGDWVVQDQWRGLPSSDELESSIRKVLGGTK